MKTFHEEDGKLKNFKDYAIEMDHPNPLKTLKIKRKFHRINNKAEKYPEIVLIIRYLGIPQIKPSMHMLLFP